MIEPIEKSSNTEIQTSKKRTNTKSVDAQIQKNAYFDKSLQTSREDGSEEQ